jgi:hypothetical protein
VIAPVEIAMALLVFLTRGSIESASEERVFTKACLWEGAELAAADGRAPFL